MKIGSLFAGYDGIGLGLDMLWPDLQRAWFVEFDQAPSKILAHHWPTVVNHGDITAVDWDTVEPVDILTGGFPCQDLSHAGKRLGLRPGTRSGLWEHMAYAIDRLRPRLVVIENVRGLLSAEAHSDMERDCWCVGDEREPALRALGAVLGDLAELGYDARWGGVRAADAGAPHGRFRVFIVAQPADADLTGLEGRPAERQGADQRPAGPGGVGALVGVGPQAPEPVTLGAGVGAEVTGVGVDQGVDGGESLGFGGEHASTMPVLAADLSRLLPTATASMGTGAGTSGRDGGPNLQTAVGSLLPTPKASDGPNGGPGMRNGRGEADALPGVVSLLPTPTSQAAKHGALAPSEGGPDRPQDNSNLWTVAARDLSANFGPYAPAIARWEAVLGRPAPSPTEPGKDGRPRLSPRFVEWMMGLPAGHVTALAAEPGQTLSEHGVKPLLSRAQQLKALGNGVVPQQAALALRLLLGLGAAPASADDATLLPSPATVNGKSTRAMTASTDNGRRSGGGQSSPPGLEEVASLLAGVYPDHMPPLDMLPPATVALLPTPNPFHAGNEEDPDEWRKRRADVFKRTGTRHGPALGVVAKSLLPGQKPLTPDTYMPEED